MKQTVQQKVKNVDPSKVKKGDVMAIMSWVKVQKDPYKDWQSGQMVLEVADMNQNHNEFQIKGEDLISLCLSANRFDKVEEVTQTEMLDKFVTLYNQPFEVVFDKDDGTERTLVGQYLSIDRHRGRSNVLDLSIPPDKHRLRQVNHRGMKQLITGNVKYVLKGAKK